jgi:hypothetical protein
MAQTAAAVAAHLPIAGLTALVIDYVWGPSSLENAHRAEFWEACDELTNARNASHSLQHACLAGNEGIVRMIAAKCTQEGIDAGLATAVHNNREGAVRALLELSGDSINGAILSAADHGYATIMQMLLRARPRVPHNAGYNNAALQRACRGNHVEVVRLLLIDYMPSTSIWDVLIEEAATYGRDAIIWTFVTYGVLRQMPSWGWGKYLGAATHHPSTTALIQTIMRGI